MYQLAQCLVSTHMLVRSHSKKQFWEKRTKDLEALQISKHAQTFDLTGESFILMQLTHRMSGSADQSREKVVRLNCVCVCSCWSVQTSTHTQQTQEMKQKSSLLSDISTEESGCFFWFLLQLLHIPCFLHQRMQTSHWLDAQLFRDPDFTVFFFYFLPTNEIITVRVHRKPAYL